MLQITVLFKRNQKKMMVVAPFCIVLKKIKQQLIEHDRLTLLLWYCAFFTTNGSIFIFSFFFQIKNEKKNYIAIFFFPRPCAMTICG